MGTPITKAASVTCDSGGKVDLSGITSSIQVDGKDVVDVGDKPPILGCLGHPPPPSTPLGICISIASWSTPLDTLADDGQSVAGFKDSATPIASSNVETAVITCSKPGNTKLFAN